MMKIFFNMYVMKIIKEGVKEKFSFIEKQVIDEIYRELFKEMQFILNILIIETNIN